MAKEKMTWWFLIAYLLASSIFEHWQLIITFLLKSMFKVMCLTFIKFHIWNMWNIVYIPHKAVYFLFIFKSFIFINRLYSFSFLIISMFVVNINLCKDGVIRCHTHDHLLACEKYPRLLMNLCIINCMKRIIEIIDLQINMQGFPFRFPGGGGNGAWFGRDKQIDQ